MKKQILLLTLITAVAVVAQAQTPNPLPLNNINGTRPDSMPVAKNEIGMLIGGYYTNAFAPEWYLNGMNMNFATGFYYKRHFNKNAVRLGYYRSTETLRNAGGKWTGEAAVTGSEKGSNYFVGVDRTFYASGIFQFYAGIDMAMANYSFNGYSVNTDGDVPVTTNEQKTMMGMGINPYYGVSFTVMHRVKFSIESSINDYYVKQSTTLSDPQRVVTSHKFVCGPNPLKAVTASFLF